MKTTVEIVRLADRSVVDTIITPEQSAGQYSLHWEGSIGRAAAPTGRYAFHLVNGPRAVATAAGADTAFVLYDHIFPIRGGHNRGSSRTNRFGGGRGHQGQDMLARCGTPIVAARGGRVKRAGYQSAAGYYVVIDGKGTKRDYVYMHMRRRPLVTKRQQVFTGQELGEVGETGRATGCHLHFELWSGPWLAGGRPVDPLPYLRTWDAYG